MLEPAFKKTVAQKHFDTPGACYDALMQRYGGADDAREAWPRYLFRGESRYFTTSTPGTYRAMVSGEPIELKFARIDATGLFVEGYEDQGGDSDEGECLAQHYLSTSDGLDFSASLGVAMAFALDETEIPGRDCSYICVLDRERAESSLRFSLHDLREMHDALRPVRQHGFVAVHHAGHHTDLKAPLCRRDLGLVWFSFAVSPGDVTSNRLPSAPSLDSLYDIRGDPWAKRMIEHLDSLIGDPSSHRGEIGLSHLLECRTRLLSRTRAEPRTEPQKASPKRRPALVPPPSSRG